MTVKVKINTKENIIPKDYRRLVLDFIKSVLEKENTDTYEKYYSTGIILASMGESTAGGYMQSTDNLFLNSLMNTDETITAFVNKIPGYFANTSTNGPLLHELGHKYYYDTIKTLAKNQNIDYNEIKKTIDSKVWNILKIKQKMSQIL